MLNRDARHDALAEVGAAGQQRIAAATVLIVGVGGIGCAAATYLASSGVGKVRLADFDTVDETNLARQFLFRPEDIGQRKAVVAEQRLSEQNPDIKIESIVERVAADNLTELVRDADIVLDGCDNFATRFAVNDACVRKGKTLVVGSAIRLEGQCVVFGPDYTQSACYRCLYNEADESMDSCDGQGVLAAVPGVIGTMMAVETLKILAGLSVSTERLTLFDAASFEFNAISVVKNPQCGACADR